MAIMFVCQRVMNHPQQSFTDGFTTTNQVCILRLSWFEGYLYSHGRPTTSQLIGMVGWLNGWPFACQIHVPPQKCFERSTHLYQLLHIPSCQGSDIFTSSDPSHIHIFWGLVRTQIWAATFFSLTQVIIPTSPCCFLGSIPPQPSPASLPRWQLHPPTSSPVRPAQRTKGMMVIYASWGDHRIFHGIYI